MFERVGEPCVYGNRTLGFGGRVVLGVGPDVCLHVEEALPSVGNGPVPVPELVGEALLELRHGVDLFLSLAPTGCMVTSMGEVMTPRLQQTAGQGRIQSLFSSDGYVDEELLELALLRALGPEQFTSARDAAST